MQFTHQMMLPALKAGAKKVQNESAPGKGEVKTVVLE